MQALPGTYTLIFSFSRIRKARPSIITFRRKIYTAFHKNMPAGKSGCRKKRLNNETFFWQPLYTGIENHGKQNVSWQKAQIMHDIN
jgi:hypothetical protein